MEVINWREFYGCAQRTFVCFVFWYWQPTKHFIFCCSTWVTQVVSRYFVKVECKSHPRTNSRVPWGAVKLCCFEKISWARMVKFLCATGLEFVVCVYTCSHQCYASCRLVDRATLQFKPNCDMRLNSWMSKVIANS